MTQRFNAITKGVKGVNAGKRSRETVKFGAEYSSFEDEDDCLDEERAGKPKVPLVLPHSASMTTLVGTPGLGLVRGRRRRWGSDHGKRKLIMRRRWRS
jgi:hypothetical protein